MKKQLTSVLFLAIAYGLPLLLTGHIDLILDFKIISLIVFFWLVLITQPAIDLQEARIKKETDQFSVFIILGFSVLSVGFAVYEWANLSVRPAALSWEVVGAMLLLMGLLLRIWSIRVLGKFFTTTVKQVDDHQLVTTGPYARVRHPSYLGAYLAFVGNAVFLGAWRATILALILMLIAYAMRIKIEEKTLIGIFGERYLQYQKQTRRLFPFIW